MSLRLKKVRQSKSKVKVMLITFFDVRGIVHSEFLPQGQTINQQVYKEILQLLLHSVHKKRRELWQDKLWLLHHDNAPAHNALSIRQFLAEKKITMLEQPPCSPDLAPCDLFSINSRGSSKRPILKAWRPSRGRNDRAEGHPRRILPAVHRRVAMAENLSSNAWKSALHSRGITLKGKPCSLLFGIEINCL